jgi:hypothetical protein
VYYAPDKSTPQTLDVAEYKPIAGVDKDIPTAGDHWSAGRLRWDPSNPASATIAPDTSFTTSQMIAMVGLALMCMLFGFLVVMNRPHTTTTTTSSKQRKKEEEEEEEDAHEQPNK